jgi:MtfA peptidase
MIFTWLKRLRRRRILARPFPDAWLRVLNRNLPFYSRLNDDERDRLRNSLRLFIAEKSWEGCAGLEVTEEIKVTIAAQACLLVLGRDGIGFDHVKTILVYPDEYYARQEIEEGTRVDEDGTIFDEEPARVGEAWYGGPVILSWRDVRSGGWISHDGYNVVFHEFAHQLDMQDGIVNGTPPLDSREAYEKWAAVMTAEFERLKLQSGRGMVTLLDGYGAQDPGEFFAVCAECFFERPLAFATRHRELYNCLKDYFRQDPAEWQNSPGQRG